MSALWNTAVPKIEAVAALVPMTVADVDAVMAIEAGVYPFPWTRGNFIDSLAAGYDCRSLRAGGVGRVLGYFVAMAGAGEMHLLNITVAPAAQRQGHARAMLAALVTQGRRDGARRLWLEVRESNAGARAAYARLGFAPMGVRLNYYPAPHGKRESAVVMSLEIQPEPGTSDALE